MKNTLSRVLLWPTLFFLCTQFAYAVATQDSVKTWIFLTDKLDIDGKRTVVEEGYLTTRALERRMWRGTTRSIWHDAPVSSVYTDELASLGITVLVRSRWLNAVSAWLEPDDERLVADLPFVQKMQPVARRAVSRSAPGSPANILALRSGAACDAGGGVYGPSCHQLDLVNAILPLERGINGQGVVIGFLDELFGRDTPFQHSSLQHLVDSGRLIEWRDFSDAATGPAIPDTGSPHGMQVASVAVGHEPDQIMGPCHGASVLAASTENVAYERNVEEDNFVAGVEWLESQGVDIMTASIGYTTFDPGQNDYSTDDLDGDTGITTRVYDWAAAQGVVTVAAAGNEGEFPWQTIITPADGDSVIAVGGVEPDGSRAPYSSIGPTADGRIKPDVAAQSSQVYLADLGGYERADGTSFAAPMVAGVACQILQVNDELTPMEVREILRSTASQSASPDNLLGWGLIDANAAVLEAEARSTSVSELPHASSAQITVSAAYPNPFTRAATIELQSSTTERGVKLELFNLLGQSVDVLFEGTLMPGRKRITLDGTRLSAGPYFYVLSSSAAHLSGSVILVR